MRATRTSPLILAGLLLAACGPEAPVEGAPRLVTLGTFQGEIDADAGTFTIRPGQAAPQGGGSTARLVIATGASTVTIGNNGTPTKGAGTGTCNGFTVLAAPVRITLGASNTGFAGGLYAEIQEIVGTGGDACNSATSPTGSGLSATLGLWSYGTVRSGATTADQTWNMKVTSGQRTTFTGRIVGVAGTSFATTLANNPYSPPGSYSPIIAYTRTWSTGDDGVAYARGESAGLAYLDLAGANLGSVVTPEKVTSVAAYKGAAATDDILWFTTNQYVGVVYRGTVYSNLGGSTDLRSVVVDPSTAKRAWFASRTGSWLRSVAFDTTTHEFSLGTTVATTYAPFSIEIGRATNDANTWWIYAASNTGYAAANWIGTYSLAGVAQSTLTLAAACNVPYTLVRGPDGKLWFATCRTAGGCGYCNYDPATATFSSVNVSYSSGTLGVARSTTGAGDAVWALDVFGKSSSPVVHQAIELVEGASATSMFAVDLPDSGSFAGYPGNVPTLCGSPAVGVHPAYLWWTSDRTIYRLQPQ